MYTEHFQILQYSSLQEYKFCQRCTTLERNWRILVKCLGNRHNSQLQRMLGPTDIQRYSSYRTNEVRENINIGNKSSHKHLWKLESFRLQRDSKFVAGRRSNSWLRENRLQQFNKWRNKRATMADKRENTFITQKREN